MLRHAAVAVTMAKARLPPLETEATWAAGCLGLWGLPRARNTSVRWSGAAILSFVGNPWMVMHRRHSIDQVMAILRGYSD